MYKKIRKVMLMLCVVLCLGLIVSIIIYTGGLWVYSGFDRHFMH